MTEAEIRRAIVEACRAMNALGINQGTSGNISVRHDGTMLITPTSTPYDEMCPEDIAAVAIPGEDETWKGRRPPSTEWRFHRDILRARPEAGAIVHAHPPYCTALAIARRDIPGCHYMMAVFGGTDVRVADYATFGTSELSRNALAALEGRSACLLANHGMIVFGPSLRRAMWAAVELETIARQYYLSLLIGGPHILSDTEIADAGRKLGAYGAQEKVA